MESKFKVGDSCAVYYMSFDGPKREVGEVASNNEADGFLRISIGKPTPGHKCDYLKAHSKQCRKLVKKPRLRVWISKKALKEVSKNVTWVYAETDSNNLKCETKDSLVEFIEVKKK